MINYNNYNGDTTIGINNIIYANNSKKKIGNKNKNYDVKNI